MKRFMWNNPKNLLVGNDKPGFVGLFGSLRCPHLWNFPSSSPQKRPESKFNQLQLLMEVGINAASLPMYSKHLFVSSTILRCTFYPQKKNTKERDAKKMVQWTSTLSYSALGTKFRGNAIPTVVMNWFNDATPGSGQFFWPWAPHPKPGQLSSWKQRSVSERKQLAQGKSSPGFLEGKLHSLLSQISGLSASTCGCQHALVSPFMYYLSFFSLIYTMRKHLGVLPVALGFSAGTTTGPVFIG